MARPSKCRICGYRFKQGEDICPECFTARDEDITCGQFSQEEHSHSSGFSTTHESDVYDEFHESSFIDEQKREEAHDPIPDSTYGGKFGTPPPTYAQQSYQRPKNNTANNAFRYANLGFADRASRLNSIRNGTYNPQNPNMASNQGFNNGNKYYTASSLGAKKANSGVVGVVVVIFIISFFIPIIVGIVSAVGYGSKNSKTTTKYRPLESFELDMSMPEFSFPDISVPDTYEIYSKPAVIGSVKVRAASLQIFKPINTAKAAVALDKSVPSAIATDLNGDVPQEVRFVSMVFEIDDPDDKYTIVPGEFTFESKTRLQKSAALSVEFDPVGFDEESGKYSLGFFVPTGYDSFVLHVPLEDKSTGDMKYYEMNISLILIKQEFDSYGLLELDDAFDLNGDPKMVNDDE